MKLNRRSKRTLEQSQRKLSNCNIAKNVNNIKKKFPLSFINKLTWFRRNNRSMIKLSSMTSISSPRIEDVEMEVINTLKTLSNKQLLTTNSADSFSPRSTKPYIFSSFGSNPVHQSLSKIRQPNHADMLVSNNQSNQILCSSISSPLEVINHPIELKLCLKKQNSLHHHPSSLHSISQFDQQHNAPIIEVEHQLLSKTYSSPLPIKTNHLSVSSNHIQSAHLFNQDRYGKNNAQSSYSSISDMESISSDEESVKDHLLTYERNSNRKILHHRWSLLDIWEKTMSQIPTIINCIWQQKLHHSGSREFLLECDQISSTNKNNNQTTLEQEQRYVEQERPIHSHFGLALFAFLIFPPLGIFAVIFSIWSLCGQQDRHLSRKFGHAVYWISLVAVCLAFCLLFTLFTYFIYQYLVHQSTLINSSISAKKPSGSFTKDIDYI